MESYSSIHSRLNPPVLKEDYNRIRRTTDPSLLLDFDDLPAGGSSKVGERDRKLTRVGGG